MKKENPAIIIVHGLFMRPAIMNKMARFFEKRDYKVFNFGYDSRNIDLTEISTSIQTILDTHDECHFVGHSLGGLIIRHVFEALKPQHTGIVVTLGTPHKGAVIADFFYNSIFRWVLGNSVEHGLLSPPPYAWTHPQELYSIAGTNHVGPLSILPPLSNKAGDGTVLLEETFIEGAKAHIQVDTSHTMMVYSSRLLLFVHQLIENRMAISGDLCKI